MKKIAITGSLASGKSTVCQLFRDWGAYVVNADALIHEAFSVHHIIGQRVITLLGNTIAKAGQIDRALVSKMVFADPQLLSQLEDICHPYVFEKIREEYNQVQTQRFALFVAEVPLLFESRYTPLEWFDVSIAVVCHKEQAMTRYLQKGGRPEQFDAREKLQLSVDQKRQLADYILENNGTIRDLSRKARHLFLTLCHEATLSPFPPSQQG